MRRILTVIAVLVSPLHAQTPDNVTQAAATITLAEVAQHLSRLIADSLRHRATPSPPLEQTARYVAEEFQRLGLTPGAADPAGRQERTWIQRYPVPGQRRGDPTPSRPFPVPPPQPASGATPP